MITCGQVKQNPALILLIFGATDRRVGTTCQITWFGLGYDNSSAGQRLQSISLRIADFVLAGKEGQASMTA